MVKSIDYVNWRTNFIYIYIYSQGQSLLCTYVYNIFWPANTSNKVKGPILIRCFCISLPSDCMKLIARNILKMKPVQFLTSFTYYTFLVTVNAWVKVFRINPEFRILRLTFHRKSASNCWIREIIIASLIGFHII